MKLRFVGGLWDGVEFRAARAPQEIRLRGVLVDDNDDEQVEPAKRKTVLISKLANDRYEIDRFEGPHEEIAVYRLAGPGTP